MRFVVPDDYPPIYGGHTEALDRLRERGELAFYDSAPGSVDELVDRLRGAAAVVNVRMATPFDARTLDRLPDLRLISVVATGIENVELEAATARGVIVSNVPGTSTVSVAELTFGLLLSLVRKVSLADRLLRDGHWPKAQLGGPLLAGKTLGVVGAGRIGSRVGEMGAAWGMRAIGCVDTVNSAVATALAERGVTLTDFDTVVSEADFLCLHLPLDEHTRHIVDARVLSRMKDGSFLVNVARGGVVDEQALYTELTEGDRVLGAALDVHESEGEGVVSPLAALPNVVLTPHIGAMAWDAQRLIGERVVELLGAHERGCLEELLVPDEMVTGSAP